MDSIKKWAQMVGATGTAIKVLHDIATTVGPHIHLHIDGKQKKIEFATVVADAQYIIDALSAKEPTDETLHHAEQKLAELQQTFSSIINQLAVSGKNKQSSNVCWYQRVTYKPRKAATKHFLPSL